MAHYNKFNFVMFLSPTAPYYKAMFYDAFALSNLRVIDVNLTATNNNINLNFSPYRPSNNPAAFKNPQALDINSPQFFANDFLTKNPIVFFFLPHRYNDFEAIGFFKHLRNNYPNCKLVMWLTDPIHHFQSFFRMFVDKANTEKILSTFDCVLTYNPVDAMEYGLTYFEGPCSVLPFEQPKQDIDIFFVAGVKDRLKKILRAYETFKAAGFVCDFYIANVPNPPPIKADGLHFNEILPYDEVLTRVLRSKGILDIMHKRNYGLTLRYFESLAYNKNFITDNPFYRQDRFFSPKLFLIDRGYYIDKRQFMNAAELSNNYRNEYSPLRLISFLESVLNS